jgi:hypothetical protein
LSTDHFSYFFISSISNITVAATCNAPWISGTSVGSLYMLPPQKEEQRLKQAKLNKKCYF